MRLWRRNRDAALGPRTAAYQRPGLFPVTHQDHRVEQLPNEIAAAAILDRVALMTPENIHLNSFMYEPIIDMGEGQLRKLYSEAKALMSKP